jgi:hypothetical protein
MKIEVILVVLIFLASLVPTVAAFDILSPTNSTYNSTLITLHVSHRSLPSPFNTTYTYSLDGKDQGSIPTVVVPIEFPPIVGLIEGQVNLTLSNGPHCITVYALHVNPISSPFVKESTVYFAIDDPNLQIVPAQSATPPPTPGPCPTLTINPTASPSSSPTPSPSTSISPSPSPTPTIALTISLNPTHSPSPTLPNLSPNQPAGAYHDSVDVLPVIIGAIASLIAASMVVGLTIHKKFGKRKT